MEASCSESLVFHCAASRAIEGGRKVNNLPNDGALLEVICHQHGQAGSGLEQSDTEEDLSHHPNWFLDCIQVQFEESKPSSTPKTTKIVAAALAATDNRNES